MLRFHEKNETRECNLVLQTFDEKNENDRKTCKLTVCNKILQFGKKRSNNGCQINLKKSKKCSPFHSLFLPTPCFLIALAMVKPSVVGCSSSSSLQGDTGDPQILDLFKDWSGKNCYSCTSLILCKRRSLINSYTGGPLLTQCFETLEKQPCKQKTV